MRNIDKIKNMNVKELAGFLLGDYMEQASRLVCNESCKHWKDETCGLEDNMLCPITDEEMLIHWLMQNNC